MNNISALNQVFTNLNQNLASLGMRVNSIVGEMENVKAELKQLKQVNDTPTVVEPHVSVEQFQSLVNDFNNLKTVHEDFISKIVNIENSVEKNERVVKDIAEQLANIKIACDNLHAEAQHKITPNVTTEDVQGMIDNAINSLIGVLTTSGAETGGPLPTILEIPLENANGVTEYEIVDEIQGSVDANTESNDVDVVLPLEHVSEVQEPIKKKGRGGRKPSTKK
jgi:chaperonin cofactor prefoldin